MEGWSAKAVPHLSVLFFVLVASWGWGFYLDHYELLYSTQGVVYGAGYTADHVTRIAYWIMRAPRRRCARCWCSISSGRDSRR